MSDEIQYLDFELTIHKAGKDKYMMRAEFGDKTVEAPFVNPFNEDKREIINSTLTAAALRRTARTRAASVPEVSKMKDFGGTLFENVIAGSVDEFLTRCRDEAAKERKGIRWRLALDPSLEELPWEFLCDRDRFLALDPRNPIVRYIKPDTWIAPLKAEHPLRLLVVIASPKDEVPLDTDAEKQRILGALKPLAEKGQLQISIIEGPDSWERIIDTLMPDQTHILHFIGHGAFDDRNQQGVLVMEDSDGNALRINSERLSVLMQGKSRLRLIVLNSCLGSVGESVQPFSSVAAGMVRSGIPAVIAMQFEISDEAAREIAETFYTALALNRPVDAALTEARRKIYLTQEDSLEWATPILYMQVPDGQLFEFKGGPDATNLIVRPDAPPPPGWGARWNDLTNWWKSGKEKPAKEPKEPSPESADVFDKGRDLWYTIIGAKGSLAAPTKKPPPVSPPQKAAPAPGAAEPPTKKPVEPAKPKNIATPAPPAMAEPRPDVVRTANVASPSPTVPSPQPPISPKAPASSVRRAESWVFQIGAADTRPLAEAFRQRFFAHGFEAQVIHQRNAWLVQGRPKGPASVEQIAATILIEVSGINMTISIGSGKCVSGEFNSNEAISGDLKEVMSIAFSQKMLYEFWNVTNSFVTYCGGKRIG
jgi:cell division septation protein DedD